ncbi:SMC5-SMC6 complex localization factor protein 1 isoform X2 [Rhinatrema bivittatum]|uniref:SMC5-SMC6 complex localization factor protein 1 isoform X2 n=1 Tax=Rhinatrema bivittatum TaxID=194408 RepID=UPI00112EE7D0|nr:SMC5-SMC6 complex localization factor protein 1 isoform X2 [Rhinatrema bivittatum]
MEEDVPKRKIQITGFKDREKDELVELLFMLDCIFIDSEKYENCTHLIAKQVCKSEKYLATCAAGKWVLTKDYVINSAKSGRWLDETTYEWGYKIEKDSHYSPQMQSAPKRWREELTRSSAPGAFHRWKVVLLVKEGDKRRDAFVRVLLAGKAHIYYHQNIEGEITHVFTNNRSLRAQQERKDFSAPYYPIQYLGEFLLENTVRRNSENNLVEYLSPVCDPLERRSRDDLLNMQFAEMKITLKQHICLAQAENFETPRVSLNRIEGLLEGHFFIEAIEELSSLLPYFVPPVHFLQTLIEHLMQGNLNINLLSRIFDIFYTVLHLHPPWKSDSMLRYYLDLLQCPVCTRGTWSLIEMLVRSCLNSKCFCHAISNQEMELKEQKIVHETLLKFVLDVVQAEVQALSERLCEWANSHFLEDKPQPAAVLVKMFWSESKASILFTKSMNALVDWVIYFHKEKSKTDDVFKHQVAYLLNGILGAAVEYWVLLGFLLDKCMIQQVTDVLANYISILCDDFSSEELEVLICSIPSPWLQMYVSEAVFKNLCLKSNICFTSEPLSLQKMVSSYLSAVGKMGMCKTEIAHKKKRNKMGPWPQPESQRVLLMLNGEKQNHSEVLPDLPELNVGNCTPLATKLRTKLEGKLTHSKENCLSLNQEEHFCKHNTKGETALHIACMKNKVEKLILLLSLPGTCINLKDYAGWTPLHEACNHGSTECVREILQRCPEVDLLSQVDGVTPLHDALSNGHVEIGKLLLQHGGPVLLQQRDLEGKVPLDYVASSQLKEELFSIVQLQETVEDFHERLGLEICSQQIEFGSFLLCKMLLNFCSVYDLPLSVTTLNVKAICSDVAQLMSDSKSQKRAISFSDWLVEHYARNLENFQKIHEFLREIPDNIQQCTRLHAQTLLSVLKTLAIQLSIASEKQ